MCVKGQIFSDVQVQKGGSSVASMCKSGSSVMIKGFVLNAVLFDCQSFQGDLQHVQVSQLTIQHPVVAVMGCQPSVCVMYSMCNLMGNQLVFLKIGTNLYLWFEMVSSRNTVQFLNEIDQIHECQHRKSVQKINQALKLSYQCKLKKIIHVFI